MHEELKRIMEFFDLDTDQKTEHLGDVFKDTVEFFNRFKHVLEKGSAEEKKAMIEEVLKLQEKLELETNEMCDTMEMNEDELKEFSENPENFSEEEWQTIQEAKQRLESQASEIEDVIGFDQAKEPKKAKSKKSRSKSKKWMKS